MGLGVGHSYRYPVTMTGWEKLHPGKVTKERPNSHTHPNFWLSPRHQLLINPPSIFLTVVIVSRERVSNGLRFSEAERDLGVVGTCQ